MNKKQTIKAIICNSLLIVSTIALFIIYIFTTDYSKYTYAHNFCYFTQNSNLLIAITSLAMLIYEIRKLHNPDINMPKWLFIFRYIGVTAIGLTFTFVTFGVIFLIFYEHSLNLQWYANQNTIAHLTNPLLAIFTFCHLEKEEKLSFKLSLVGNSTSFIYSIIYLFTVGIFHVWEDFYRLTLGGHVWMIPISMLGMYIIQFLVCRAVMAWHNHASPVGELQIQHN